MGSLKAFFRRHVRHRRRGPSKSASLTPTPSICSHHRLLSVLPPADELHRVFSRFDANGDGRISSEELASIFSGLGHPPTDEELHSMMAEADTDGDGFISLEEFVDLNTRGVRPDDALEDLREAFGVFDLDGNGAISAEELAKVMRGLGDENATTAECRKMIVGVDRDGDGTVSFEEFKEMMLSSGNSHYSIDERSSPEGQGSSLSPELAAS